MSEADKIIKSLRDSGKKVEEFYMSNKTSDENVANEEITNNKNKYTYIKEVAERIVNEYREKYKDEKFYPEPSEQTCMAYEILHLLAEREQMLKTINTVEKEKADWIKAYQEEKDSQFELLKRIQELETKNKYLESLSECQHSYLENSIPTQVVIDKINENSNIIKEIEEKIKEEENSGDICREYIRDLNRQKGFVKRDILTLQELLEGEKNEF